ncbi:hypothetical protein GF1_18590 [Desulfolithobacter dissulfuricans]|uniref:Glycosyltransferase RgtA/B/C/D-like domain-containing protein n=1 Tax=Desulfolithobacter dissulfuricans TaxID=2795293 RepID=A0A915U0Z7_9BACT|nr:hypothetical protein GF1_18590 [Desulfolithobacter dissulfuricans]
MASALVARPPVPIDETRYLSVAWEMWQSNQFLVPHINGLPYSHKPPLLFWLIHLGWFLFGVNAWSARLTAPLFGFAGIILTMRLAAMLWPENKEVRSAVPYILTGMFIWSLYGTLTMFDMLLVFFSLLAWLALVRVERGQKAMGWALFGLATGLGLLAKGPVILVYVLPPALFAPWWSSREGNRFWLSWYGGLLAAVTGGTVLALCWALPAARAGGVEYGQAILFGQTAGRVVHSFAHQRPFYWYGVLLPVILFPWFFCLSFWTGCRRLSLDRSVRFCLSAVVPSFFLLSAISGKQLHYSLPLLPPVALLAARGVTDRGVQFFRDRWPMVFLLGILGLVLSVIPWLPLQGRDAVMLKFLPPWIGIGPVIVAICFLFFRPSGTRQHLQSISWGILLLMIFFHLALYRPLHTLYDETALAVKISKVQEQGRMVAVYPAELSDQFQFAGRLTRPLKPMRTLREQVAWSLRNPEQFCLIFTSDRGHWLFQDGAMKQQFKHGWLILCQAAQFSGAYQQWKKGEKLLALDVSVQSRR